MDIRGPTWELGVRYAVGNIEVGGGVVIFGGWFAKRGVRTNPPNPPPVTGLIMIAKYKHPYSSSTLFREG